MADFAALADRLIRKNGRTISVRRVTQTPVDTDKPWGAQTDTTSDSETVGVFIDQHATDFLARVSAVSRLVLSPVEVQGTSVLIPGTSDLEPTTADKIVDGDRVWGIAKVTRVQPGEDVALYIVELGS
jgi:hypothetical protein